MYLLLIFQCVAVVRPQALVGTGVLYDRTHYGLGKDTPDERLIQH
jgi:hypothetical protein